MFHRFIGLKMHLRSGKGIESSKRESVSKHNDGLSKKSHDLDHAHGKTAVKNEQRLQRTSTISSISKYIFFKLAKTLSVVAVVLYVVIPVVVKTNPWIQNKVIFLNNLRWPPFIDFTAPEGFGLESTRNFYLTTDQNIRLGLWHALPESLRDSKVPTDYYTDLLKSSKPIILYLHGNSGTRAGWHRVQLYKVLANMDYHVIAVDYRGYGDSSGSPSEDGVVSDALFVYRWINQHKGDTPIFIWGHSLGTGVTTKLARTLCRNNEAPDGVFLESGFNNILDAATYHPMASPFRFIPWFNWLFLETITHNDIHFQSDVSIADVSPPLLILHAEDDVIVPYHLGVKLYEAAVKTRPQTYGAAEFVSFNASHRYGHKLIFMAPELPDIIRKFMKRCLDGKK
ncbi:lysophosphatidylserine lipase ABHD12-like [Ruditapes philippinarum]|uniref:lysophosphatidylserine lipase ABHD12-like n=1 Tax=Ruditapes philippinarum TaxID=129788 RepID=UPI00295A9663|nr:lysophosphatidylserine lipase ABHD12-like [Ruditapes philippinarum]